MKYNNDNILISFGIVIGSIFVSILFIIFIFYVAVSDSTSAKHLLLGKEPKIDWETILTGLLAVTAAVCTVFFTRKQIHAAEKQIEEMRSQYNETKQRKIKSYASTLPLILSEMMSYCDDYFLFLEKMKLECIDGQISGVRAQSFFYQNPTPTLPQDFLSNLRESVEYTDDKIADTLSELSLNLQIYLARIRSINKYCLMVENEIEIREGTDENEIRSLQLKTAEIHARSADILIHCRDKGHIPGNIEAENVMSSLTEMRFFYKIYDHELRELARKWDSELSWYRPRG